MTAAALREWRVAHQLTQPQLAALLGVSPTAIYLWESGRRPQTAQSQTLALALEALDGDGPTAQSAWQRIQR